MTLSTQLRLPTLACGIACMIALAAFAPNAVGQDKPAAAADSAGAMDGDAAGKGSVDKVFATVDGEPITAGDIVIAADDYARQFGIQPSNVPVADLLNVLIDMRLVANAAEKAGLDQEEAVKQRLEYGRLRILHNAYLSKLAAKAVTDEKVRARYDEEVAKFEPQDELHLQHILVDTEDEAKAIIAEIKAGGDFAEIAKEKSKDPGSGPSGGDLNFVARGDTVPAFEKAAFALNVGEITEEPVKTQFGWHIIKLDEKRKSSPPEFATEENRIRNELFREFATSEMADLRDAADIQIIKPEAPAADGNATSTDGGESSPAKTPAETTPAQ